MIGLRIDQAKSLFFDRDAVLKATERAERNVLSKFGSFVRQRARSSIRKRKAVSLPGNPPSSHVGLVRQFLFFAYDPTRKSVVIGPVKINKPGNVLDLLEHGGETTIVRRGLTQRATYRPRPFMQPAFEAELKQSMPGMWQDTVKG